LFLQFIAFTAREEGYGWHAGTGVYLDRTLLLLCVMLAYIYSCFLGVRVENH